jgi:hypothetical protein
MLLFIFGTIASSKIAPSEIDTQLLEFSKHPSSEAIFATMSMQLTANGGFNRVLALLNDLVHDGKSQLHKMALTFRAVEARCSVSQVHFKMSQEFFQMAHNSAKHIIDASNERLGDAKDSVTANALDVKTFVGLGQKTEEIFNREDKLVKGLQGAIAAGISAIQASIETAKDWNPKSAALIQVNLRAIKTAFVQVHKYELTTPTALIQSAASDEKVRARLMQWLNELKSNFQGFNLQVLGHISELAREFAADHKNIVSLTNSLSIQSTSLNKAVARGQQAIVHANASLELHAKLLAQNANLMKANQEYCQTEDTNFHAAEARNIADIKIFVEIRKYFIDHYANIQSFIKSKYAN